MRDEFGSAEKELLAKRVAGRCSNPGCRHSTSGPQENPGKTVNIGVAAHITAAAPDGPRYDNSMTPEERGSAGNGLWLCQSCAKLVDNDPVRYSVDTLRRWKGQAEALAARELEQPMLSGPSDALTRVERVMPELLAEMRQDLAGNPLRREFVLLKRAWGYLESGTELMYYFDDHPDLLNKIRILENEGFVRDVTTKNVQRYRMSEPLARYLGAP